MLKHLEALCQLSGVSGNEGAVRAYLQKQVEQCADISQSYTDRLGNFIVCKKGRQPAARRVLLAAHMDEVGMIVTYINSDGTLKLAAVGGIDPSVLIGRQVLVGEQQLPGVIGAKAVHHLSAKERDTAPSCDQLYADFGAADKAEAQQYVQPGDYISFLPAAVPFGEGFLMGKGLDDRAGCAMLLALLEQPLDFDTWFAFTVQEEVGLRGARTAAFGVDPEVALALETTTAADWPDVDGAAKVCRLGGGAVVPFMDRTTLYDRGLYQLAGRVAKQLEIPIQTKTMVAGGNDAGVIHTTRAGVRTLTISVPCRNLHSPSVVAKLSDVDACLNLAKALLPELQSV